MIKPHIIYVFLAAFAFLAGCSSSDDSNDSNTITDESGDTTDADSTTDELTDATDEDGPSTMDFFLTSVGPGDGANLGGLAGADAHCGILAEAAGSTGREWRAYLSTTGDGGENASERIGEGPWANANGVVVATSVDNLLDAEANNLTKETSISENGAVINGRGDIPNRHDILTGTDLNGLASTSGSDTTCGNWTSNSDGSALVGHHDRVGGGADATSWSTAHGTSGCSQENLQASGGDGLFYCFAIN